MQAGSELEAIRAVVLDYMEGMIFADLQRLQRALHSTCLIVGHVDAVFTTETVQQFSDAVQHAGGLPVGSDYVGEIVSIDVSGPAAMSKVNNRFAGVDYTDYLTLLRLEGRWTIMHKTYHEHVAG